MKTKLLKTVFNILLILGIALILVWLLIAQPTTDRNTLSAIEIDIERLEKHVNILSNDFYPRNHLEVENLNKTAAYIEHHFKNAGGNIEIQNFEVSERLYKNVIAVFGEGKGRKLIVGAHYDSSGLTHGADDNASGVSGLIELAYLFEKYPIDREIELVAYTLEEPPYFGTRYMGSYVHAEKIRKKNQVIEGMISLEMIGFFSDETGSQIYPNPVLNLFYPSVGNYITVVGSLEQRGFTKAFKVGMEGSTSLPVYSINAPKSLPGIDYSDHRNYWSLGVNAIMISDTAFYRNREYHEVGDTAKRLDYEKMAKVVVSVFEALKKI